MREIILDTETTGLDPNAGHRIIEIGCIELYNHVPTGRDFHCYINPERDVPAEAAAVHGLTFERLEKEPVFAQIVDRFLDFIRDARLVIHNAGFDMGFLNAELSRLGRPLLPMDRAIDTVMMARRQFPGAPASLDALCRRFGIDNSNRQLHGALLDADLLAKVYLELRGGRQPDFIRSEASVSAVVAPGLVKTRPYRAPRAFPPSEEELAAHRTLVKALSNPLWASEESAE
jgi:DNA polymerase-3 subunit epsilon